MGFLRWLIGGLVGGLLGAGVWLLVSYNTGYEVGWIAWGIGFVVGLGVRLGAHLGNEEESPSQGVVAAAIAIGSIVAAKLALYTIMIGNVDVDGLRAMASEIKIDEEAMIASMADEVVKERTRKGQPINWPAGISYEDASREAHYPPEIWTEGLRKWLEFPEPVRKQKLAERIKVVSELQQELEKATPGFGSLFSGWDFLWFGLAAMTAFKVAEGSQGDD